MGTLLVVFCVLMAVMSYKRAMAAKAEKEKADALLERDPQAWRISQEWKLEEKGRKLGSATGALITIAKWWLKR